MASLFWPRYFSSYDRDYGLSGSPSDSCYTLKAYIPDQRNVCTVRVLLRTLILSGPDGNSQVFRAELRTVADGQLSDQGRDVVCKVAYGQRQIEVLQKEAELYNTKLRDLQGTVVPLMHGCYVDDTDDGPTGVLVLQYCGVPLTYELKYYSVAIRTQAVNALIAIHKAGVQHNDFYESNLLVSKDQDGSPRVMVIDFDVAFDHTCRLSVDTITPYEHTPDEYYFPCDELYAVCMQRANIWLPRYARLFGTLVPVEYATSVDSMLEHVCVPEDMAADEARDWAQEAIDHLVERIKRRRALDQHPVLIQFDADDSD